MEGAQYVDISGQRIKATEGDILFYPMSVSHTEWTEPGTVLESAFLSCEWDGMPKDIPIKVRDRFGRIRILMEWLLAEQRAHKVLTPALTQTLCDALLTQFMSLWMCPDQDFVEKVRRMVRERIQEPVSLDWMATAAGMSKFHFVRQYRALTGRTPMSDVRVLRVEYARDLLMTTSLPLKVIAEKAGMGDQYHMSHLFKRVTGTSPGRLRSKQARPGDRTRENMSSRFARTFKETAEAIGQTRVCVEGDQDLVHAPA
jgi:AraC-like DNA-binding protein